MHVKQGQQWIGIKEIYPCALSRYHALKASTRYFFKHRLYKFGFMFQPLYPLERLACAQWVEGWVAPFGWYIAPNSRLCQEQTSIFPHSIRNSTF
jgi:hypothetical protein